MNREICLLLIEDSSADAELLVFELENQGFQLQWKRVESSQALTLALHSKTWDIVISDYFMPGFSGFEALRIVRQHDPILPFILVSGAVGEEVAVNLIKEGAQDYLLKHNLVRLASSVKRALEEAKIKRRAIADANQIKETLAEVKRLKAILEQENNYLKEEIKLNHNFDHIIYSSDKIAQLLDQVEQVAPVDATVLIMGETGTGKELIARSVHNLSPRKNNPLVKVNCAALPKDLIESELFGHEKGAFTGASQQKIGRFELAQNGTIFLDEIGELPLDLQPKLLRVLQEGELQRLGGNKTIHLNVRVIAATNRDLRQEAQKGKFREDLFYRLHVFPITIPPLRDRKEDIGPLVNFFIQKYGRKFNKKIDHIPNSAITILENYDWPGNIRELENMVERALILSRNGKLPFAQLLGLPDVEENLIPKNRTALREVERKHIIKILTACRWKINGSDGAAEQLELAPSTLRDKMKKLNINRPTNPPSSH